MKNIEISYENSKGEVVTFKALDSWTFCGGDIFGFTANQTTLNNKIIGFGEVVTDYTLSCAFLDYNNAEYRNKLVDVISVDLQNETKGRLIYGDNYRYGWITSIKFGEYTTERACPFTLSFSADTPYWLRSKTFKLEATEQAETGTDYPLDYPHDYNLESYSFSSLVQDFTDSALVSIRYSTQKTEDIESCSLILRNDIFENNYLVNYPLNNTFDVVVNNTDLKEIKKIETFNSSSIFSYGSRTKGKNCFEELPRGEYICVLPNNLQIEVTLAEKRLLPWMD